MKRTLIPPLDTAPLSPTLGSTVQSLSGLTMGTSWSVQVVTHAAGTKLQQQIIQQAIQQELDLVVAQMSTWENDSNLSLFNQAAVGSWQTLPVEFFTVLEYALQVARDSDGAYDPTAGALVNLWGFGPTHAYNAPDFIPPNKQQLEAARNQCGWQRVWIDPATRRAQQPGDIYIDLSAIAKGFGVDQVARRLRQLGYDSFLVEVGGELRGEGVKPDGQPWWVALEQPPRVPSTPSNSAASNDTPSDLVAALHHWSVATSGDYRRYFKDGGTHYSHTIDTRSGMPISHDLASVTVLHRECMAADAWSTALGVMGPEQGLEFANAHHLCALFIRRCGDDFAETMSDAMKELLS